MSNLPLLWIMLMRMNGYGLDTAQKIKRPLNDSLLNRNDFEDGDQDGYTSKDIVLNLFAKFTYGRLLFSLDILIFFYLRLRFSIHYLSNNST